MRRKAILPDFVVSLVGVGGRRLLLGATALAAVAGAALPAAAGAFVQGTVFEEFDSTTYGNSYDTGPQAGSPTSDVLNWTYTCVTCTTYGVTGSGAAKVVNGSLGVRSSLTVSGSVASSYSASADSVASYDDSLNITGGTGDGILKLQYAADGTISQAGTGTSISGANVIIFNVPGVYSQIDNGAINDSSGVGLFDGGTNSNTVTFYVPFTYGTDLDLTVQMISLAHFDPFNDTPTFTSTVDYYNTLTLTSAVVFDGGDPLNPGPLNADAVITASTGFTYGPDGLDANVPEPGTLALIGTGLLCLAALRRRRRGA